MGSLVVASAHRRDSMVRTSISQDVVLPFREDLPFSLHSRFVAFLFQHVKVVDYCLNESLLEICLLISRVIT